MKISVIVPVYNGGRYIHTCLLSLQNQLYHDWEVVFVNDGSTDNTERILLEVSNIEPRAKVISQVNAGVAKARDAGVKCATGDYILFLDVDDTLESFALQVIVDYFEKNPDVDILVTSFNIVSKGKSVSSKVIDINKISALAYLKKVLTGKCGWELCAKAYRKKLFGAFLRLPENIRIGEDAAVFIQLVANAETILGCNIPIYNYVQNEESASHKKSVVLAEETLKAAFFIEDYLKQTLYYKELRIEIDAMFLLFYSNSTRRGDLGRQHPLVKIIREKHMTYRALSVLPFFKAVYICFYSYLGKYMSALFLK